MPPYNQDNPYDRYTEDEDPLEQELVDREVRRARRTQPQTRLEPFDLSGYDRRGGGQSALGRTGSYASTGATIGSVIPGVGTAIGAGVGAGVGALGSALGIGRQAKTAKTDFMVDDARDAIGKAFQQYAGRDPLPGEVDTAIRGQGWETGDRYVGEQGLNYIIDQVQNNARIANERAAASSTPAETPPTEPANTPGGAQPLPDYTTWGSYRPEGLDADKVSRGHDSPKYQIARILSHFDPKQGITPDVLAALNALGIGTFEGSGEDLRVTGDMDQRFQGVTGADVVRNFTSDDNSPAAWVGWGGNNPTGPGVRPTRPGPAGGGYVTGPSGIRSLVPQDTDFYNSLQARLQEILGGPAALDREALLRLLGGR